LDGDLSDAVWKQAAVLDGFQHATAAAIQRAAARSVRGDPSEFLAKELTPSPEAATRGFVYCTDTHLYLAFDCLEPSLDKLRINTAIKNAGPALCLAAAIMVAVNPHLLWDASFQLSFWPRWVWSISIRYSASRPTVFRLK
jgi:hypothetical protein